MTIDLLILSFCTFLAGAALLFLLPRRGAAAGIIGPWTTVLGSIPGLVAAVSVFFSGPALSADAAWRVPSGSLAMGMDPLSAVFAIPILFVSSLSAIYGSGYMKPFASHGRDTARFWGFFNLLVAGMLMVTVARNALLFLLGWEVMAISSFFLVVFEAEDEAARKAGWTYLVASHAGTACILVLFAMLGGGGTLDFDGLALRSAAPAAGVAAFVLALTGFGTKAGFVPLHVWLPEAHPAAPSNVSAVMSGVMIKTGIYGLLRFLMFLGSPPAWWGWVLLLVGMVSGVAGVLSALAQHDLKRLLAYHSVENIGIIGIGLGLGLLGISYGIPAMAFLGFAGGLLHMINHAVFKSLLFMGAGSVLKETGTREIDHLGGLLRRMPSTGIAFLVGSVAICGLPPLNGFVSELLVYLAAFTGLTSGAPGSGGAPAGVLAAGALALIGGLALACFTKAFGIVFLGEPRSLHAEHAHETAGSMRFAMWVLSAACLALGLAGPLLLGFLRPAAACLSEGFGYHAVGTASPDSVWRTLGIVSLVSVSLILVAAALLAARARLLSGRKVTIAPTWDCGFSSPSPSMQYTASSFADPVMKLFGAFLRTRRSFHEPQGIFPDQSSFSTVTPDVCQERLYRPVFTGMERLFSRFRMIQHGRVNLYILYIVAALFALLVWKLG